MKLTEDLSPKRDTLHEASAFSTSRGERLKTLKNLTKDFKHEADDSVNLAMKSSHNE